MQEYFFQKQLNLLQVVAFYDEDVELQRSGYLGLPVYSRGHLPRVQNDLIIILAAGALLGKDLRDTSLNFKYSTLLYAAPLIIDPTILWRTERLNIGEWCDIYGRMIGKNVDLFNFVRRVQKSNIDFSSANLSALEKYLGKLRVCDRLVEQEYLYLFQNFSRLRNLDGAKKALRQWRLSYKKSLMRELMEGLLFSEFYNFSAAKRSWERAGRLGPTPKYFWPKIIKTYEGLQLSPPPLMAPSSTVPLDGKLPMVNVNFNLDSTMLSHKTSLLRNNFTKLFIAGQLDDAYKIKKELLDCVVKHGGENISYEAKMNYVAALLELGDYSTCISNLNEMREEACTEKQQVLLSDYALKISSMFGRSQDSKRQLEASVILRAKNFYETLSRKRVAIVGPLADAPFEDPTVSGADYVFIPNLFNGRRYGMSEEILRTKVIPFYSRYAFLTRYEEVRGLVCSERIMGAIVQADGADHFYEKFKSSLGERAPLVTLFKRFRPACFYGILYAIPSLIFELLAFGVKSIHVSGIDFFAGKQVYHKKYEYYGSSQSLSALARHDPLRTLSFSRRITKLSGKIIWTDIPDRVLALSDQEYLQELLSTRWAAKPLFARRS